MIRSNRALHNRVLGKTWVHSEKGRLVVIIKPRRENLWVTSDLTVVAAQRHVTAQMTRSNGLVAKETAYHRTLVALANSFEISTEWNTP